MSRLRARSSPEKPSALETLHIECEERDYRFLRGDNFFGTETHADPLLPIMQSKAEADALALSEQQELTGGPLVAAKTGK